MRRSIFLVPIAALVMALLATPSVAARRPIALGVSSADATDLTVVDAFEASMGVRPATWTLWSTWGDRGGEQRCVKGKGTCAFPSALVRGLRKRGITPVVYWQPTDPSDPAAGRFERYQNISAGMHDHYIRNWARAAKAFGKPVIVRFAHEMNGTWFPWSLTNHDNSSAGFKEAWRHVVRIFRQVGARNVMFLWSPFQMCNTCAKASYEDFYPGNAFVDYVGVTALNWGAATWTPLDGLLAEALPALRRLTRTTRRPLGKPVILPEVGSNHVGGDKASWISSGYLAAYQRWPTIRAINYFDYDTTFAGQPDWRLVQPPDGSAYSAYQGLATQEAFRAAMPHRLSPGPDRWRLMPLVHVVAQDGSGRFASISEAVAAAGEGDVIVVRPGVYDESIALTESVSVRTEGAPGSVVIQPSAEGPALTFEDSDATVTGLTLRGPLGNVVISGGAPTLDSVVLDGAGFPADETSAAPAIEVNGGSAARIRRSTITGSDVGIAISDSFPMLAGNSITANATGLLLGVGGAPTLRDNSICANGEDVELAEGAEMPDRSRDTACPEA